MMHWKQWKERLRASGIHFGISLGMAALAALLVFGLWYPYPYREISGGRALFLLVVAVDIVIGPLITLTIFNRAKPRRELLMDFTVIGALQCAALGYGLWTVFVARPVHLVFEYSLFRVVHAVDVDPALLAQAPATLRELPLTGPSAISLRPFRNAQEQFDLTMQALNGVPLAVRSELWQPYEAAAAEIVKVSKPAADLKTRFPAHASQIDAAVAATGRPIENLRYLPLVGRQKAWTALIDPANARPMGFFPLDSF
ncbi:pilus assembly protein [Verminephrobacter aporrectodeae subsp. tuberculatae]|uniref:TfpX/TfpZ family type IV pilin accessory protein n=1 Tax=Verminephrobacter aporrectodeae TaxID=1110389 RepID=UPI00223847CB|nr:TfpX/TfpZ family type IV pilin accessory protein [Verminephrobacter aporrectodeae]MCW5223265.1 pilus assembly protein [Verminephrobacter aporrectodeae subsp. tuberculatae]MCW5288729.1 pilus assembly protein [Verminephrobacter aporrectodeae subsp. tuberculatae]